MATGTQQPVINTDLELNQQISIAKADGGIAVFQTSKDIYVTDVDETVVYQSVKNVTNSPAGNHNGEVQFIQSGNFYSDSSFKYSINTGTLNVSRIQTTGANLGSVDNLTITGGTSGQVLTTDGYGALSWTDAGGGSGSYSNSNVAQYLPTYAGNILVNVMTAAAVNATTIRATGPANLATLTVTGNVTAAKFEGDGGWLSNIPAANIVGNIGNANVSGPNGSVQFNNNGALDGIAGFTVDDASQTVTISNLAVSGNIVGNGGRLSNIQGANVVGSVSQSLVASVANSVAGGNVSGAVAFASVANSVAGANVTGVVANATHAIFAASANSVAGANVTGVVANAVHAVFATNAEIVDGGNVSGAVAFATTANSVAGANVTGEVSYAAAANLVSGANVIGTVANAIHALTSDSTATVSSPAQPNITSVGTLIDLTSVGDITGGGIISTGDIVGAGDLTLTGDVTAVNAVFTGSGSFGDTLSMNSFGIIDLAEPVNASDAATKFYVDTLTSTGISYHTAVSAATTTTLAVASAGTITYNNGASGVGATLTTTGTFTLIDGVNITTPGTRVLVKNESNSAHNGVYVYTNSTTLTRSSDTDQYGTTDNTVLRENAYFFVSGGQINVGTAYLCSTVGVIVFGTTSILFSQFSTSQVYSAGTGITLLNTTFSINPAQPTITSVGTLTSLSVSGNIAGGNIQSSGVMSATGNVSGGNLRTTGTVTATGGITGASLTVSGAVTASGNVVGGNLRTTGTLTAVGNSTLSNVALSGTLTTSGNISASNLSLTGTLDVAGNVAAGNIAATSGTFTTVTGTLTTAAQPAITSVGTLTSLSVSGNVNASNLAIGGQITTPNITVTNRATLGSVSNVRITGGTASSFLKTDGLGNLSWADPLPQIGPDVTANLDFYPLFALANTGPLADVYTSASNFKFNPVTGQLTTGGLIMSNIQANTANITVVNASTLNGSAVNGSTITGTNVVTPTLTARTSAIEIKSLGTGDIKFTTVTGNVTMTNPTLFKNLLDPDQPQDAATKHYVDAVAQGLDPLVNARVATTGTLASITGGSVVYDNGVGGVGATLTLSSALTTLDGVTLSNGNRILVHLEADSTHNGVYVLTSSTLLTRATDNNDATKLIDGSFVFIAEGTLYGKIGFVQINPITTVGTDAVTWVQFAAAPNYVPGAGIFINGAEIRIDNTGVTAGSYGGGGSIPVLTINSRGQITSASTSGIAAPAGGLTGNRIHSNVFFSNLQSVGTLVDLTVGGPVTIAGDTLMLGSVTAANAALGNLVTANFFQGDGGLLSNIQVDLTDLTNGTSTVVVDPSAAVRTIIAGTPVTEITTSGISVSGTVAADTVTATTSMAAPDFIGRAQSANVATIALTSTTAETVTDADQPNITSVGTLTSLAVSGTSNLGAVGNVTITGGTNGQFLRTNGAGGLSWAPVTVSTVTTNAQPNITSVGTLTSLTVSGGVTAQSFTGVHIGDGGNLSNIQASNITGAIAFATTANLVAGANVIGAVALSTTTNSVDGANVFGEVSFAAVANSVDGANVFGEVSFAAVANSVDSGNIVGQVANALVSGTVYTASQPNITTVGTLTGLTVDGITQLGAVANVKITGGTSGQVLASDGSSGLTWNTLPIVAGFPTLPQYPDDATATSAAGTPLIGMMYYDTTLEEVKVYKTAGWTAL